jgi:uncharacterized protein (DUF1778 family)
VSAENENVMLTLDMPGPSEELLSKAASLEDTDLSDFMLNAAIAKAHQVIEDHTTIHLSIHGQTTLLNVIQNPGEPTAAMKELFCLSPFEKENS